MERMITDYKMYMLVRDLDCGRWNGKVYGNAVFIYNGIKKTLTQREIIELQCLKLFEKRFNDICTAEAVDTLKNAGFNLTHFIKPSLTEIYSLSKTIGFDRLARRTGNMYAELFSCFFEGKFLMAKAYKYIDDVLVDSWSLENEKENTETESFIRNL